MDWYADASLKLSTCWVAPLKKYRPSGKQLWQTPIFACKLVLRQTSGGILVNSCGKQVVNSLAYVDSTVCSKFETQLYCLLFAAGLLQIYFHVWQTIVVTFWLTKKAYIQCILPLVLHFSFKKIPEVCSKFATTVKHWLTISFAANGLQICSKSATALTFPPHPSIKRWTTYAFLHLILSKMIGCMH